MNLRQRLHPAALRFVAALLALMRLGSALLSCGESIETPTSGETTDSTQAPAVTEKESETLAEHDLPDELDYDQD